MLILLDTNVLSEQGRRRPDPAVMRWLDRHDPEQMRISVLTLGELAKGVALLDRRDPRAAEALRQWFDRMRHDFADRLLAVDGAIAEEWGRMAALRPLPAIDGLLAATAKVHGLALATRNTRDFAGLDIALVDPWRE